MVLLSATVDNTQYMLCHATYKHNQHHPYSQELIYLGGSYCTINHVKLTTSEVIIQKYLLLDHVKVTYP